MRISSMASYQAIRTVYGNNPTGKNGGISGADANQIGKSTGMFLKKQSGSDAVLNALLEQKQTITKSKNELVEDTIKNGKTLESIKDRLNSMDKQLQELDGQIAQVQQSIAESKLQKEKPAEKQKSGQEAEDDPIAAAASLSHDFTNVSILVSTKNKMQGKANILVAEIATDEARSLSGQKATHKRNELEKINSGINSIDQKAGKAIKSIETRLSDRHGGQTAPQVGDDAKLSEQQGAGKSPDASSAHFDITL